jgi:hypothetical protein
VANPKNVAKLAAIAQGLKHYFTGRPCKRGHVAKRPVATGFCSECSVENSRAYRVVNGDKHRAASRKWHCANRIKSIAKTNEWRLANMDKARTHRREWKKNNRAYCAFDGRRAQAAKLNRTPVWANHDWIRHAYEVAADMTAKMGEPFHVDHIIPLQGKTVSGLHVYENLQVLPGVENLRKSNKFATA